MNCSRCYRILLITNLCPPDHDGGYGLRAFEIAAALRGRGHQVDILTSKYRPGFQGERIEQHSVFRLLDYVDSSASKTAWRYFDRIPRRIACTTIAAINAPTVRAFIETRRYDLVYCFSLERVGLATVTPIIDAGIPILWHAGDAYIANQLHGFAQRYPGYRLALSMMAGPWASKERKITFEHVAFVSNFLKQECADKGFRPPNTYLIPRGYSGAIERDIDRTRTTPPTFFMACRVEKHKGVHIAVKAATLLQKRWPHLAWQLEVAGATRSGYLERVLHDIRAAHMTDRVSLLGELPHEAVLTRIRKATAFLSCATYGEPFASTIIEALANGTPLISSDAGSILEVVVPGESALLYERNDAGALAERMLTVLEKPDLCRTLATHGLKVVQQRYKLSDILDTTEKVFEEILESKKPLSPA